VVLEMPVSALAAAPRQMLNRFVAMSLMLLFIGAIGLWLVGRSITLPLKRLTAAAQALGEGDYSHRVEPSGGYEIARLGVSFNRMAREIQHSSAELTESAAAAAAAQKVAEGANAAKSNFLAAMSHELRTPLNAIAGYVDLLELGLRGPLTDEQLADVGRIKRSQRYLLGLIEEILVFSQLDAHQLSFDIDDVSIDAISRDAEAMVEPQIRSKGIAHVYEGCDPELCVRADRDKTQQILLNLLVNATKYTEAGGAITISCGESGDRVRVSVADTGVGIPREKLDHIFDAFVQLDRTLNSPREGVGLGLTISRDLARAMGGELFVESEPGKGSVFTLELPTTKVTAAKQALTAAAS
jgi:signal transduction histidine kinase